MKILNKIKDCFSIIIASFALLVSIISVFISYQSYKKDFPEIKIIEQTPKLYQGYNDKKKKWFLFYYQEILITNNGGRSVSFIAIEKNTKPGFLIPIINSKDDKSIKIEYDFYLVHHGFEDFLINQYLIDLYQKKIFDFINPLNFNINSGNTFILRYVFRFYSYEEKKRLADMIALSIKLKFNNGYSANINQAVPIFNIDPKGASCFW